MATQSKVVFYRYDGSPYSNKIDHILLIKNIPHFKVDVSNILPRPELSELLGVSYRKIPILAIGNDVYCDTSLIASALERRFPANEGFGTIFPAIKDGGGAGNAGMQKIYSLFYCDRALFRVSVASMPWDKVPQKFLDDRGAMMGTTLNPQAMVARRPVAHNEFAAHLHLTEQQLSDGREWLFDTETPSLADVSLRFLLMFIKPFPGIKEILNKTNFPKTVEWLDRINKAVSQKILEGSAASRKISGESAAGMIGSTEHENLNVVGFDETAATRLRLKAGSFVSIIPDDSGQSHPTRGKLVGINHEEIVIETKGTTNHTVKVHFPRLGFLVSESLNTKL